MAEPMRILLVLGPSTGGIGRHVQTLAAELVRRRHAVTVCGPTQTDAVFDWARTGATFLPAPVGVVAARPAVRAAARLRRAAGDMDVIHVHGGRAGAAAALAGLHPLVLTWHNAPLGRRRWGQTALEHLAARRADLVLAASPDLAERARRAGGRNVRFLPVAAPPLPPPDRSRAEVRAELAIGERPMVLAVARLERQKRLDLLVEAAAGWADEPAGPVLVVAGGGRYGDQLRALASARRSPLRLLGPRSDIADLLGAADVLALSSDWEARPLVVQEALRAGVPVVSSDVGGVRELVGPAARLVPAGDAVSLRREIAALLADPAARQELARLGHEQAAGWPSVEEMVDALESVYLDLT